MKEAFDLSLFGNESLPLVVSPKRHTTREQFLELLAGHGDALKKQLLEHGGLLFRGFPLEGAADFQAAIEALKTGSSVDYIGGDSPRTKVTGAVYTSTEAPAAVKIPLHNELSFVSHYPKHIYFYCDVAPSEKGETILGDSWVMDLVNSLQPSHKSWRQVFETDSTEEVERLCREHEFDFAWHGGSSWIRISQTRPAAMAHPETKEWVWFSQAHLYDFNPRLLGAWRWVAAKAFYARKHTRLHEVFHSDGRNVARRDLYHIMDTLDRSTVAFPWKRGDMLMLDNVLAMHGRATFAGKRRILAAMTS